MAGKEYNSSERSQRQYAKMDDMTREQRDLVHEYGYPLVSDFMESGITNPKLIKHLIHRCWLGARQQEQSPTERGKRGAYVSPGLIASLDWLLIQRCAAISAKTLLGVLRENGFSISPIAPTDAMINASLAEVSGGNERMTKREKHRRRLAAALKASVDQFMKKAV